MTAVRKWGSIPNMADRFYVNRALGEGELSLVGPEAHHLAVVCRARPGGRVVLFNGDGRDYPAAVVECTRKSVTLEVAVPVEVARELPYRVEVAAPLPKGDRGDFLVEKLTELGATRFVPLRTSRTVVEPRESKLDRLQRVVVEASKQCGRNVLMEVGRLTDWDDHVRAIAGAARRRVAHLKPRGADGDGARRGESPRPTPPAEDVSVAVGPEGGLTPAEVETAVAQGWEVVDLGPRILRVETAAIALAVLAGLGTVGGQ
jgi:16S rRNA (uracil1498-N3)-methyltransferase